MLTDMLEADIWIGLTDEAVEGEFVCAKSGEAVNYTNWADGEPNNNSGWEDEKCTHMYPEAFTRKWNDIVCNKTFHFVCEYINNP